MQGTKIGSRQRQWAKRKVQEQKCSICGQNVSNRDKGLCEKHRLAKSKRRKEAYRKQNPIEKKAILTESEVKEIRAKYNRGVRQKDLIIEYGVSCGTISKIVNKLIWKDV